MGRLHRQSESLRRFRGYLVARRRPSLGGTEGEHIMGMTIEELELETSEYLPRREVMSKCGRSRCCNDWYYTHEDNDFIDDSFNGNSVASGNNISVLNWGDTNQNSGGFQWVEGGGPSYPTK
jgi:hypothetical protein